MNDPELLRLVRERLFSAVIGDVMDKAGPMHQFLPPEVRPILPEMTIVGRAMPVLVADVAEGDTSDPFGVMFRALDELKPGEVYITAGGSLTFSLWGGLMTTRAMKLGSAGAVFDGFHRDTNEIVNRGYPCFSRGAYAQDQRGRGRAVDYRSPIVFANGTRCAPGDLVVGDVDGVVIVPAGMVADVVRDAIAKVDGEDHVRRQIEAGEPTASVFARTGIM